MYTTKKKIIKYIHSFSVKLTIQFNFNVFLSIFCNFYLIKNNIQLHLFAFKKKNIHIYKFYMKHSNMRKKVNFPENNLQNMLQRLLICYINFSSILIVYNLSLSNWATRISPFSFFSVKLLLQSGFLLLLLLLLILQIFL